MKVKKKEFKKMTDEEMLSIANDINMQLSNLSKFGKFYDDLVNEYLYLIKVRESLKEDILLKGIRYQFTNGNGKKQTRPNESVTNLIKVEQIMLKIINDLEINQSLVKPPSNENNKNESGDVEDDLL